MASRQLDTATALLTRAVDTLFLFNPRGTGLGVLSGVTLKGFLQFFAPLLRAWRDCIDTSGINVLYLMAAGIVGFNITSLKRRELPKEIEEALELIRRSEQNGAITKTQAKLQRLALCQKVIEQLHLDQNKLQKKVRIPGRPTNA